MSHSDIEKNVCRENYKSLLSKEENNCWFNIHLVFVLFIMAPFKQNLYGNGGMIFISA